MCGCQLRRHHRLLLSCSRCCPELFSTAVRQVSFPVLPVDWWLTRGGRDRCLDPVRRSSCPAADPSFCFVSSRLSSREVFLDGILHSPAGCKASIKARGERWPNRETCTVGLLGHPRGEAGGMSLRHLTNEPIAFLTAHSS